MNNKYLIFTLMLSLGTGNVATPLYAADDQQTSLAVENPSTSKTIKLDKDTQELITTKIFPATVLLAVTSLALSRYFHSKTIADYEEKLYESQKDLELKSSSFKFRYNMLEEGLKKTIRAGIFYEIDLYPVITHLLVEVKNSLENLILLSNHGVIQLNNKTSLERISQDLSKMDLFDIYEIKKDLKSLINSIHKELKIYPDKTNETLKHPNEFKINLDDVNLVSIQYIASNTKELIAKHTDSLDKLIDFIENVDSQKRYSFELLEMMKHF